MADKHDQTFMGILSDEGQVIPFLDSMFGFLYRCTDFFRLQHDPGDKLGFPPGIATQVVLKVLQKWEKQARLDDENYYKLRSISAEEAEDVPPPYRKELVDSGMSPSDEVSSSEPSCSQSKSEKNKVDDTRIRSACDSYNGAVREGYQWSQTISDVDVQITVPDWATKAKHVKVDIDTDKLHVRLNGTNSSEAGAEIDNGTLFEGDLSYKTKKEESAWTLIPGKEIQIHLEKCQERWWDSLITTEEKINLQKIDASRPIDDLPQEEQMKIQELMWAEQRKRMGELDPRHQPVAEMLKKAWNQEGSPFKGMEYNPSMINFDGDFMPNHDMPS